MPPHAIEDSPSPQSSASSGPIDVLERRERYSGVVNQIVTRFYLNVTPPTMRESLDMAWRVVCCNEQYEYRFSAVLHGWVGETSEFLEWHGEIPLKVTYVADSDRTEIGQRDIMLRANGNESGCMATFTDRVGPELSWSEFLLIYLEFAPSTITYRIPSAEEEPPLTFLERKRYHFVIYDTPLTCLGRDYIGLRYFFSNQQPSSSSSSLSSESSVSTSGLLPLIVRGNPYLTQDWFWEGTIASSEKLEFNCELEWNTSGSLGYRIHFLHLYGTVNGERMRLNWVNPERVPVQIEYYTERKEFERSEPVHLTSSNPHTILLDADLLWDEYIFVSLRFDQRTIKYRPLSGPDSEDVVREHQRVLFYFPFSSEVIRGQKGGNVENPHLGSS